MRPDRIPRVILQLFSRFLFTHTVSGEVGDEASGQQTLASLRSLYTDFVSWHLYLNHLPLLSLSLSPLILQILCIMEKWMRKLNCYIGFISLPFIYWFLIKHWILKIICYIATLDSIFYPWRELILALASSSVTDWSRWLAWACFYALLVQGCGEPKVCAKLSNLLEFRVQILSSYR